MIFHPQNVYCIQPPDAAVKVPICYEVSHYNGSHSIVLLIYTNRNKKHKFSFSVITIY